MSRPVLEIEVEEQKGLGDIFVYMRDPTNGDVTCHAYLTEAQTRELRDKLNYVLGDQTTI